MSEMTASPTAEKTTGGPCALCPMTALGLGCSGHVHRNAVICRRMVPGHPHRDVTIARQADLAQRFGWTPNTPPATPPTLAQKVVNLGKAVVQHVAAGRPLVPDAVAAERLAICRTCENLDGNSCRLCGCNMPIKVTWAEQACPIGKWGANDAARQPSQAAGQA